MKTDTSNKIISYLRIHPQSRVHDLAQALGIGKVALHRQLNRLSAQGSIQKSGIPPRVFYELKTPDQQPLEAVKEVLIKNKQYLQQQFQVVKMGVFGSV